jgi:hypothetical protein
MAYFKETFFCLPAGAGQVMVRITGLQAYPIIQNKSVQDDRNCL